MPRQNPQKSEATLDDINVKLNLILEKLTTVEDRITNLEEKTQECAGIKKDIDYLQAENLIFKNKIILLEKDLDRLQNTGNRLKLELCGLPFSENENLLAKVTKIAENGKCTLLKADIANITRFKGRLGKEGQIELEFVDIKKRDEFLSLVRKSKPMANLIVSSAKQKIYVNEKLTAMKKKLLYNVKQTAKDKNWSATWVYANNVYVKFNHEDPPVRISSTEDLETLLK